MEIQLLGGTALVVIGAALILILFPDISETIGNLIRRSVSTSNWKNTTRMVVGVFGGVFLLLGVVMVLSDIDLIPTEPQVATTVTDISLVEGIPTIQPIDTVSPNITSTYENPSFIWVYLPSDELRDSKYTPEHIVSLVAEKAGLHLKVVVPNNNLAAVDYLCNNEAHIATLDAFAYVAAHLRGCVDVSVIASKYGTLYFQSQLVTMNNSGIESISDLVGETFCRPMFESTSGWKIPRIHMLANGFNPEKVLETIVDSGDHDEVIKNIYNGDCIAGATYMDARGELVTDFPDIMEQIVVISITSKIPNNSISFSPNLSSDIKNIIIGALLDISSGDGDIFFDAYRWDELVIEADGAYDDFRNEVDAAGMKYDDLLE